MKILVTGAAGFIASHLCERLLKEGHDVIGLDNLNNYYDPKIKKANAQILKKYPQFKLITGEILDEKLLAKILKTINLTKSFTWQPGQGYDHL